MDVKNGDLENKKNIHFLNFLIWTKYIIVSSIWDNVILNHNLHVCCNFGIIRVISNVVMIQSHEYNVDNDAECNEQFCEGIEH